MLSHDTFFTFNKYRSKFKFLGGFFMTKGKFGIVLPAIAVLTFVCAFFGFIEALLLLLGYVLIVEANSWLTKQTLQALFLAISVAIAEIITKWIFGGMITLFNLIRAFGLINPLANIQTFILAVISVFALALCVLAFIKVIKEQDANLPIFGDLADKSLGLFTPKPVKTPPVNNLWQNYNQPPAPTETNGGEFVQPPIQPPVEEFVQPSVQPPMQPPVVEPLIVPVVQSYSQQPIPPIADAPVKSTPAQWTCACGRVNNSKFCAACGGKNPNI
jgi:uncharacterized membrane protein